MALSEACKRRNALFDYIAVAKNVPLPPKGRMALQEVFRYSVSLLWHHEDRVYVDMREYSPRERRFVLEAIKKLGFEVRFE